MNIILDPWIPVIHEGQFRHIALKDLLCTESDWQLCTHRNDMELAALQLIISLTQVIFAPDNPTELKQRTNIPLTEEVYDRIITNFDEMFILDHPVHPFMQTRGVRAQEVTSMQKLFIGLPEGNNHAFFNDVSEISSTCLSCTAIALFNQATNCPSFGGGFKGSLRGGAPLTTLVFGETLRTTVWRNILNRSWFERILPPMNGHDNYPVWISPIKGGGIVHSHQIGILRGLFWQPAHIEVIWGNAEGHCEECGSFAMNLATGFKKEKFNYELKGVWPHPHGPRGWLIKKGERKEQFASFTTTAPAWTQLNNFLINQETEKEGQIPAAVVSQFKSIYPLNELILLVGGYRTKQASVLQRRHEMVSLAAEWAENMDKVERFILLGLEVKDVLRRKMYGFGKTVGLPGLAMQVEELFYRASESIIHQKLHSLNWREASTEFQRMVERLCELAVNIFEGATQPYRHDIKMIKALSVARRTLSSALSKITI